MSENANIKLLTPARPLNKFCSLMKVVRICCRVIGADILNADYKFNAMTAFVIFAICIYYLFSFLTVLKFFAKDWADVLGVFSPVSVNTQGLVKLISAVKYAKFYYKLNDQLENIYRKYQDMGEKYEKKLFECVDQMKKILILVGILYMFVAGIIIIIPLAFVIYNGERYMVLLCHVPGVDVNTDVGFMLTNLFNSVCVIIAAFGLYAGDLMLLIFLTHSLFFYDLFVLKVQDLRLLVEEHPKDKRIRAAVNDIAEWHQFYLKFNEDCNLLFYWTITVHMLCTTLGLITTLMITFIKDWPGAYVYLVVSFIWLYMYSILGTRIEICNDKFCEEIYNINWYELEVPERKTVCLMLMKSQMPRSINIGGVMPLTVNTALMITRTIYSFLMMMLKMWH